MANYMGSSMKDGGSIKKGTSRPKGLLTKGGGKGAKGERLYTPVSQTTINKIKTMGMTAALAKAGKTPKGASAEFIQGVNRMYGAKRVAAARAKNKPASKSPDAARAKYAAKNKPAAKSPDEARAKYIGTGSNKAKMTTINKMKPKYSSKNPKPTGGLFPGLLPGGKKPSSGGLKPGALGFLKNKYEKK